ncbi:MAG: VWA-like domain-containing protein [Campylobacterota bacterium]|nr:VWA-like domain-containing protein [Campylobacterota bacterium]
MNTYKEYIYSKETIASILTNPDSRWKTLFKEMIISMIASNKNELLWYANFLSRCEYAFHFNESFTSAVYFNGINFVISINPVILGVIDKEQIIAILKHSAGHIIHQHFSRGKYEGNIDKEVVEAAKDIVINGDREMPYIKDLPRTGSYKDSPIQALFYQVLTQKYGIESYEVGREFEYYVALIQSALEEEEQSCSNTLGDDSDDAKGDASVSSNGEDENTEPSKESEHTNTESELETATDLSQEKDENESTSLAEKSLKALENGDCMIDSHAFGEQLQETVGLDENLLETFMDTTLQELIHDSTGFARGFTPSEATHALNRIEKRKSHKEWKKIFNKKMRNFLTNSMRYREPNKSRQHPTYPDDLDLYGYSPGKKPKIGVVLDVSGSVDDTLLRAFISEVQAIQKKYAIKTITLIQVDAQLKSIEKFGVHDKFIVRDGSGGTIMEPGFTALLKQSRREVPDIIICATDGEIEEKFEDLIVPNKVQVIWLIAKEGKLKFDTTQYPKQQMHVIRFSD